MTNLLLTGASGFVGRNVLPILEKTYAESTLGRGGHKEFVFGATFLRKEVA